jgi:hypothetical protein
VWAAAIGAAAGITLTLAALFIYRSNRQLCSSSSSSTSSSSASGARNSSYTRVRGDAEGIEL